MAIITLAKHSDYTSAGLEIYEDLTRSHCIDGGLEGDIHGSRLIDYASTGAEIWETTLRCCDKVVDCPRAAEDLLPEADPPGIDIKLVGYAYQIENCFLAEGQIIEFVYCGAAAGGSGDCAYEECGASPYVSCPCAGEKWVSEITLRGCTLSLELCFERATPSLPLSATLCWYGEGADSTDQGTQTVQADCATPLHLHFDLISLPNCCDCLETVDAATIDLRISGNCHPVVLARHIDYTADGTEIYMSELCFAGQGVESACVPHCKLVAEVLDSADAGCVCAYAIGQDNTYDLPYIGFDTWETGGFLRHCGEGDLTLTCTDNEDGTVTLHLDVVCGATNVGESSPDIVIPKEDMENLDVTFDVEMVDPSAGSCAGGLCRFQWNEMAATWTYLDDTCGTGCDACPEGPDDTSPGSTDGEIRTQACTGTGSTPTCCVGTFQVRVTR